MLDILVEALAELLGGKPQRGRTRRPDGTGSRTAAPHAENANPFQRRNDAEPETRVVTLDDILRNALGLEKEQPPPKRVPARKSRRDKSGREKEAAREIPAPPPAPPEPPPAPEPPPQPTRGESAFDLAARLRDDPQAAREAFIYSEIFGRPVGDR